MPMVYFAFTANHLREQASAKDVVQKSLIELNRMRMNLFFVGICLSIALPLSAQVREDAGYFQQRVDYSIDVRLDDATHTLHGQESFVYTNNSRSALDTLWIHLWPNAYRDRNSALSKQLATSGDLDLHFAPAEDRGHIDSLDFRTEAGKLTWGYHPEHADIGWITLPKALVPGDSITISTPFRVKIPSSKFSRLGHTGQAYHITQWYPKPAVFDAQGWHAMPYLTQGEFYSEFGHFDVRIALPANYVVGATGMLQDNAAEEAWMEERSALPTPASSTTDKNAFPESDTSMKTLRFVQDQVHDFAWFADKRFIVRSGSVTLARSGRSVRTWALFTPRNAAIWEEVGVTSLNESVRLYSQWVGDYPYDACTAVDGTISAGGGMEYPMITIIGNMGDAQVLDNVIAHEVGHNWFYGILGSNERDHPWMDEGMNSSVELRYMRQRYPNEKPSFGLPGEKKLFAHVTDAHRFQSEAIYRLNARRNLDQPIELGSEYYTQINYGAIVYSKTALVFDHLLAYLGEETFDRCMLAYFEEWKFKHPQPHDVRKVFERESGKDLGWVFREMIGTTAKSDPRLVALKETDLHYRINGETLAPFPVSVRSSDDSTEHHEFWFEPKSKRGIIHLSEGLWETARIDADARTLDIDRRNNEVRSRGLFRRCAKPHLGFLLGLEQDDRRSVFWTPLAAWNGHDGFQLGLALHNTVFPSQRTEWVIAPLYGFGSEQFGGAARIEHHFDRIESGLFQNIHIGLNLRSAAIYSDRGHVATSQKAAPHIVFDLKRDPLSRPWKHQVGLRGIYLNSAVTQVPDDGPRPLDPLNIFLDERYAAELQYTARDDRKLGPTFIQATLLANETIGSGNFLRGSLELKRGFTYNARGKQLRLRGFGGVFLGKNSAPTNRLQAWNLSWGAEDLLFDHAYFERGATQGVTGRQFNSQQGGFKTFFRGGGSETWTAALNAEFDLPFRFPISLFGSAGMAPLTTITQEGRSTSTATYLEAGVGIQLVRDVVEVWIPLVVSERIANEQSYAGRDFGERIRFVFALEKLDPTRALRKVKP